MLPKNVMTLYVNNTESITNKYASMAQTSVITHNTKTRNCFVKHGAIHTVCNGNKQFVCLSAPLPAMPTAIKHLPSTTILCTFGCLSLPTLLNFTVQNGNLKPPVTLGITEVKLSVCTPWSWTGRAGVWLQLMSTSALGRHKWSASSPRRLTLWERTLAPTEQDTELASNAVWKFWTRTKYPVPARNENLDGPACSQVTRPEFRNQRPTEHLEGFHKKLWKKYI